MVFCGFCRADVEADVDEANGFTCCTGCGRVLDEHVFSRDPTFTKTAGGASQVEGNFVPDSGVTTALARGPRGARILGYQSQDSHEKTLNRGRYEVNQLADRLGIKPREEITAGAHRLYRLAVQRNFTRGRRTQQVAGACLYIVCRQEQKPYMLIDFSDYLQTNVYVLGAVFLQLCELLRLEKHPILQRPVDPSLYIHRFADRLSFGKKMHAVANTALRLVASMKRDWMQTGRRPSGVCGAALFIAAHLHGFERTKRDVVGVVHVGEGTLKKRLGEFGLTPSAKLTLDEFNAQAAQYEEVHRQMLMGGGATKESKAAAELEQFTGGFGGGANPPSFRGPEVPLLEGSIMQDAATIAAIEAPPVQELPAQEAAGGSGREQRAKTRAQKAAASTQGGGGEGGEGTGGEPEDDNLSDIDDDEIERYIHSAEEVQYKEVVWTELNKDYLADKAAKEAAIKAAEVAAAASKALETANDLAQELQDSIEADEAPGAMQSPAKGKGKGRARKRGRGGEQRAETAGEAAAQVLVKKRLSSKINYAALQNLFQEPAALGSREDAGAVNRSRDANRHEQALLEERRSGPERTATGRLGSLTGRPGRASMRSSVLNRGAAQARRVRFTENPAPSGD